MEVKRVVTAIMVSCGAVAVSAVLSAASGQATPGRDPKLGTRVTITGCLHQGTSGDSFVILGVTERPADSTAPILPVPYAIYWLDSTAGLKPFVGELVDVTGKVTERRSKPGTIKVSIDVSEELAKDVKVESGTKSVTSAKFDDRPRPAGTSASDSALELTRPVYKLVVENVRPVNVPAAVPACR